MMVTAGGRRLVVLLLLLLVAMVVARRGLTFISREEEGGHNGVHDIGPNDIGQEPPHLRIYGPRVDGHRDNTIGRGRAGGVGGTSTTGGTSGGACLCGLAMAEAQDKRARSTLLSSFHHSRGSDH